MIDLSTIDPVKLANLFLHHNELGLDISLFHIHCSRKRDIWLDPRSFVTERLNPTGLRGPTMNVSAQSPRFTNAFVNEPFYFYSSPHINCVVSSLVWLIPHCFISHVLLPIQLLQQFNPSVLRVPYFPPDVLRTVKQPRKSRSMFHLADSCDLLLQPLLLCKSLFFIKDSIIIECRSISIRCCNVFPNAVNDFQYQDFPIP